MLEPDEHYASSAARTVLLCLRRDSGRDGCIVIHSIHDRAVHKIHYQECHSVPSGYNARAVAHVVDQRKNVG